MKWYQAQEDFNADLENGGQMTVHRGQTLPEDHELVKRDGGRDHLFKPMDSGEAPAKPSRRGRKAG